jgi:hypothetical protein
MPGFADVMKQLGSAAFQIAPALMGPGVAKGFYDAQAEHNKKQLDFEHQNGQEMGNFYLHLASNPNLDPQIAQQYNNAAAAALSYNPLDPESRKNFEKIRKLNPADVFIQAHETRLNKYQHELTNSPGNTQGTNFGGAPQQPQVNASPNVPLDDDNSMPVGPPPQGVSGPPPTSLGPQNIQDYVLSQIGPEPPPYVNGYKNPAHDVWATEMQSRIKTTQHLDPELAKQFGFDEERFIDSSLLNPYAGLIKNQNNNETRRQVESAKLEAAKHKAEAQEELAKARTEFFKAQTIYTKTKNDFTGKNFGLALQKFALAKRNADRADKAFEFGTFGTVGGDIVPGSLMIPGTNIPVGPRNAPNVRPTAATQAKGDAANNMVALGDNVVEFIKDPANAGLFGKIQGHIQPFMAGKIGTDVPGAAHIRADLQSIASLLAPVHGFRAKSAADEFLQTMNQADSPEALEEAINTYSAMAQIVAEGGLPVFAGANGEPTQRLTKPAVSAPGTHAVPPKLAGSSATPAPSQYTVGQVVTLKGGKKIKIKALSGTKITDYDEVK